MQGALDGLWTFGFGVDFESHRSSGFDGLWTSDSKLMQLGANVRRDVGAGSVGATLSIGTNRQSVTRLLDVTQAAEAAGDRNVTYLTSVLDYTYELSAGGFTLQPGINLGTSQLRYSHMSERGAGSQNAEIFGGDETHLWAEPAIGGRYVANFGSGASLHTFARVGLLQYLSGTSTKVRAGLEGAPSDAAPMRIGSDLDRTHFVGEAGLQYQSAEGLTVGLSYTQRNSEIREGGAGSVRFVLPLK
jgi:hypothetical protein